ncbi:MAG: MmgE/PrpD family protein [Burkholderiales bacterium]|nr:MmgE/PrpD family protein [Burkholderiales bacterium]
MKDITRTLARYACAARFDDLPSAVRGEGVRALVNYVGCAAGGAHEDDVDLMVRFLGEFDGGAQATLVGRSERLDILNAAFINSMSSAALAFNDTHFITVAHPTSPVAAALLALAERRPMTGRDLLHALVLGVELQCRAGMILTVPPAVSAVGLSMQGMVGSIGAAVAAAKVLQLDETGMTTAIGLAANQSAGLREAQSTMASHYTPGHAARCGLAAALLAARGFECSGSMLEGAKGFAVSFAQQPNLAAAIDGLGERFEISTLAYKPYPAGVVIHPIIDACLEIVREQPLDAGQIERVELRLNPLAAKLTNVVDPKDRGQALVSFQHWTVSTLLYGAAGIAQVANTIVRERTVAELRRKVSFVNDESVSREAAHVRVVLKDGSVRVASVSHCRGSVERPLTDADITTKTEDQLRMVFAPERARAIVAQSWRIETLTDLGPFCRALAQENEHRSAGA